MENNLKFAVLVLLPVAYLFTCHFAKASELDWHVQTLRYGTLSSDVNRYYHLVGFSKDSVWAIIGRQPAFTHSGHDFYEVSGRSDLLLEIVNTSDKTKISKFRYLLKSKSGETAKVCGPWQYRNLRSAADKPDTVASITALEQSKDPFAMPFGTAQFSSGAWINDVDSRTYLLFDLAHIPIVGLSHSEVTMLLGKSETVTNAFDCDLQADSIDGYVVEESHIGNPRILQIAYRKGRAIASRLIFSQRKFPH